MHFITDVQISALPWSENTLDSQYNTLYLELPTISKRKFSPLVKHYTVKVIRQEFMIA